MHLWPIAAHLYLSWSIHHPLQQKSFDVSEFAEVNRILFIRKQSQLLGSWLYGVCVCVRRWLIAALAALVFFSICSNCIAWLNPFGLAFDCMRPSSSKNCPFEIKALSCSASIFAVSKQPAVESAYGGWHGTKNVSGIKLAKDTASLLEKSTFVGCFFNNSMRELVCIWRVGIFAFLFNTKRTLSINLTRGSYSALGVSWKVLSRLKILRRRIIPVTENVHLKCKCEVSHCWSDLIAVTWVGLTWVGLTWWSTR